MQVSGYSGNAGDGPYGFSYQDGMMFSTYDRDNDQSSRNCAALFGGGFWHNDCYNVCVNCGRQFKWHIRLQTSRMWLTC